MPTLLTTIPKPRRQILKLIHKKKKEQLQMSWIIPNPEK